MSVYKEGFKIIENLLDESKMISNHKHNEYLVRPVKRGDETWNNLVQLYTWYGNDSRIKTPYGVKFVATLLDEWAIADERKTNEEATEKFLIIYTVIKRRRRKSMNPELNKYDGYVTVRKC